MCFHYGTSSRSERVDAYPYCCGRGRVECPSVLVVHSLCHPFTTHLRFLETFTPETVVMSLVLDKGFFL